MAEKTVKTKLLVRSDTASNWSSKNTTLLKNELAYDETNKKFKIGDGATAWNSLSYIESGSSSGSSEINYIELSGSISGFNEAFGIENINITETNYNQFLENKSAPIKIEGTIFQLDTCTDEGDNNYIAQYFYILGTRKYYITICWYADDLYVEETYYEKIGGINKHTITSGTLSFDNPTLTLTTADNNAVLNAEAIICSVEVSGAGTGTVTLYKCSQSGNYIGFTDAILVLNGERFFVRYVYLNILTRVLTFTPDA